MAEETSSVPRRQLVRAALGFAAYLLLSPALLFLCAGTAAWPMGWVYVLLALAAVVGSRLIVRKRSPDTLRERARFTAAEGMKPWDRFLSTFVGLIGPLLTVVIAGLDHRYGWPPAVPILVQVLAALVTAGAFAVASWAMVANRYFSAVARIQQDRGQVVVTGGPYRFVRHPAYATGLLTALTVPVMLDAFWALVPGLVTLGALVVRTRLEDRMLRQELVGYEEYAARTRYRLIPGVW